MECFAALAGPFGLVGVVEAVVDGMGGVGHVCWGGEVDVGVEVDGMRCDLLGRGLAGMIWFEVVCEK